MSIVKQAQRVFSACAVLAAGAALAACGDDDSSSVSLTLLTPEPGQILTLEDDTDPDDPGLQLDVTGSSRGLRAETPVELYVDGAAHGATGDVDDEGNIALPDVTLEPGEHRIYLRTAVGSVQSDDEQTYTFRALVIELPEDGDAIGEDNDENADIDGIQITVRTQSYAIESEGDVSLRVDGDEVATATPDADGTASFENITLAPGEHTLQARVGSGDDQIASENVVIEIIEGQEPPPPECENVELLAPSAPGAGAIVLGGAVLCDDNGNVTTSVRLNIDDADGMTAELELNGQSVGTATIAGGTVEFEDVELSEASGNELTLVVGGEECTVTSRDIQLDCAAPSCVISSPEPLEVGGTLYLSGLHGVDGRFDVQVESDAEAQGQLVGLVIDGDSADALTATAEADGSDAVATFDGVALADGPHTLRASCRDALGNIVSTPEVEFVVDTTPCTVEITAPAQDAIYLPGNDVSAGLAGVQLGGIANVVGDDCVEVRAGVCDGELTSELEPFDGQSPHTSLLTLADGETSQQYCVDVRDHVGNIAGDVATFMFRQIAPMVLIESPATGTSFNAAGGGAYVSDSEPTTPLCDAELVVACEVGTMVELRHDDENGPLIATGECEADDDAPTGYTGRATISGVISDENGDASATIVATQTFAGSSGDLTGVSAAVTYATDCQGPVVVETSSPCSLHASGQITDEEAAAFAVALGDETGDTVSADLSYWIGEDAVEPLGDPSGTQVGGVGAGSAITFSPIDFGDLGPLFVGVTLEDDVGNTTEYLCESEIVDELPSITVVQWPADGAEFGPGDSECDPDGPGEYGVQIEVTIDRADDRQASLTVNGEVIEDELMIVGTTIEYCVPVPDDSENETPGPTTIRLQVEEIAGNGLDFVERELSVHTILITDPVVDQLIVSSDDCDAGAGFGYEVTVEVDEMHDGSAYTIVADGAAVAGTVSAATITACVPVTLGGERTFTASIDGTDIEHSVTTSVVDDTPMIVAIMAPADGADFGVGDQTCIAAGVGTYGVRVQATVDQADNREASILVNGMLAIDDVAIGAGGAIDACVDVPDDLENAGPTTITLNLATVLGTGVADTESVEINVDTLDIVDPVEDQMITAVDDCFAGSDFGYEVELAVDVSHLGAMYSITDGTQAATTGVIMDDTITACVALTPATGAVITASIVGTPITETVTVDIEDAPPSITAITMPADDATFGPGGQTCATAGAGNYGVRVQATVDQADNRVASVLVNGTEAVANAPITGNMIDVCVAVPDNLDHAGPSMITVRLEEEPGDRIDTETITVNVDKLNFTAPVASQHFTPTDDCDPGAGFGIMVSIAVDPSLAGASYVVDGGDTDLTGAVAGAAITGCLAVTNATTAITASITGTLITETVPVTVFTGGPPSRALTFTRACPATSSASYREDPATLTWGDLSAFEDYEGQFATLQLRCAHTGIGAGTAAAWWTAATPITLPGTVTVASTSMPLPFRVGEQRFCALRASNAMMEQSPVGTPVDVTCGFRSTLLHAGTAMNGTIGFSAAAVGDVNGDGIDDVIVGGSGRAELFLGRTTPFTGTPDTVFTTGVTAVGSSLLGFRLAGLGDFNNDGLEDFAISDASFDTDAGSTRGRASIFFGRASWPATVTLPATSCGADLCFDHSDTGSRFSVVLAGAGDFDGDGVDDLAATATNYPANTSLGQFYVIRGASYERRACTVPGDCRATETCGGDGFCARGAGQTFWNLSFALPSGDWVNTPSGTPEAGRLRGFVLNGVMNTDHSMGRGVAAVGPFDSTPGTDLVVAATGRASGPAVASKLYFLSGRAHSGTPGMTALTLADLGFRASMGGTPSGTPFHTTTTGIGAIMTASGNIYDVPGGATPGARDILVKRSTDQAFYVYPGDNNFSPADRILVNGVNASDLGASLTMGYSPALLPNAGLASPGLLTDFDGDGRSDFAAGARGVTAGATGNVYLWYGDALNSTNIVGGAIQLATGSQIQPPSSAGVTFRVVEAAGDVNDDGHPDLVVGHPEASTFAGEVYLLY